MKSKLVIFYALMNVLYLVATFDYSKSIFWITYFGNKESVSINATRKMVEKDRYKVCTVVTCRGKGSSKGP